MPPVLIAGLVAAGALLFYKWEHKWFIKSSVPGTQVQFGADRSGNTTVALVPGQDLGTLTVASGENGAQVAAQTPDGSSITSYTSSAPSVYAPQDSSALSQPNTGAYLGTAAAAGVTQIVFSSDAGWRSSFTVQAT